jgi:glutaredoxin
MRSSLLHLINLRRLMMTRNYPPMRSSACPAYDLLMYSRSYGCPFITSAKRVLDNYGLSYREIMIDRDPAARDRVVAWTGFQSVPTLVAALPGSLEPHTLPAPLPAGSSPRGVHRGAIITEPNPDELITWLHDNGFLC